MASLNGKLGITIQLLSNTLRSKDNHTTQFDQLIEYTQNVVDKQVPKSFLEIKIEHISGSAVSSFMQFASLYIQFKDCQIY